MNAELEKHRENAKVEYDEYNNIRKSIANNPSGETVHLVFDFAEKVTLPVFERQPGQLHFITGLRYDIFGIYCSNLKSSKVFGLPEGHWPGTKDATSVLSMLLYIINMLKSNPITKNARKLVLHADNCAGQNKNRFSLWFFAWLICAEYFEEIELKFLVAGHTKNVCDGAFGLIKRIFRKAKVYFPKEMHDLINRSAKNTDCIEPDNVIWRLWKAILSTSFTIPSQFRISQYHVFRFSKNFPGCVQAKHLTSTEEWSQFDLLKKGGDSYKAGIECRRMAKGFKYTADIQDLEKIYSPKEGTRKKYLLKHICDHYFSGDTSFITKYFSCS